MKTQGEESRLPIVPNPYLHVRSQEMNVQSETLSDGSGVRPGWYRLVLEVSPDGQEFQSTGGDYAPNPHGCDQAPIADPIVRKWRDAYQWQLYPWWRRDQHGWPIETFRGQPVHSFMRLVCQNLRKLWPRRKLRFLASRFIGVKAINPKAKIRFK